MVPFLKSTVRNRKEGQKQSTQRFLPIAEIRNDTVLLKNGGLRAVLLVEAINYNLKSETEQQGIIAGYGNFVNTVTFPLQILIRSTHTNIDEYLEGLTTLSETQKNALLKSQILSYVAFMRKLLDVADIMQKRFYVIVPMDSSSRKKSLTEHFFDWIHPDDTIVKSASRNRDFGGAHKNLGERVELVQTGLNSIGLRSKRLSTRDLLELYYQIYNPKTSQEQKIPQDIDQLKLEHTVL